jgi:malonate-semialdehyde dehydrogenase (acetylating) / methylmalonate-semialdehyde dehydrogenase
MWQRMTEKVRVEVLTHWVGGGPTDWEAGRLGDVYDPATGELSMRVTYASAAEVDRTVGLAAQAWPAWRDTSLGRRADVLFRFRSLLSENKAELAALITAQHGKVLADAAGEIERGLEVVDLACGSPSALRGFFSEQVSGSIDVHSVRQPLGVVGVISPFNFPVMVPLWFTPIAIAAGNAVILKPSERDPAPASFLADLWRRAGLPAGIFNVVHGDREAVDALLEHPGVAAISFVGSTPVARHVYETAAVAGKRVQALGGAKNHMLVLPDAELDLAADAAVSAAYGSAGERCMAISVVVAVDPVGDDLVERIRKRIADIKVGDGRRQVDMGPLITRAHRDRVASYIDTGLAAGAELVVDGRNAVVDGAAGGFWLGPTLFDRVTPEMPLYTDEIFGPLLSVVRAGSFDEGLALINASPYGNGTSLFTSDGGAARRFQREVEAGLVGINVPIPVPVAYYSFGGWKQSLFGDTHAYGPEGFHFFTKNKVVTSRWPDRRDSGVKLNMPVT